eukprot:1246791-Pleurochrysis_carterae.AAC.1
MESATLHAYDQCTVTREAEGPLDQVVAMRFGISTQPTNERTKMHKCQCQNMPMRMNGNQFRELQFQSDPRDRRN